MFFRHRAILRLIENEGGHIDRLRLVKLAFLLSQTNEVAGSSLAYQFVPYKKGPFSFTLYHDLGTLERDGWLKQTPSGFELIQNPALETASLDRPTKEAVDSLSERFRRVSTSALVDTVYREYPWYTVNAESSSKRADARPKADCRVYTAAYEGLMVDGLLDLLLRHGIRRLIDVRANPIARRYGFHKSTLNRLCANLEIEYVHIPALGVPSAWRANVEGDAAYEALFAFYVRETLPRETEAIDDVCKLVQERPSALLCMEADCRCCHRSRLAEVVSRRTGLPACKLRDSPRSAYSTFSLALVPSPAHCVL